MRLRFLVNSATPERLVMKGTVCHIREGDQPASYDVEKGKWFLHVVVNDGVFDTTHLYPMTEELRIKADELEVID